MKSLLSKIRIRRAVGLYLGEHELSIVKTASTPAGTVEIASLTESYESDALESTLERTLKPLLGRKGRAQVGVALPCSRFFYGTRLMPTSGTTTPEAMLQKAISAANLSLEELVVDFMEDTFQKVPVAHLAACRKKYMAGVVTALKNLGVRPVRAEPAACALVRLAERRHRAPRRSKVILRVLLGETQAMAAVVVGGVPIAWKMFTLPEYSEGFAMLSAARCLKTQQAHYGIETPLDYAMIHGRPKLQEQLQQEQLPSSLETRVIWCDGPQCDGQSIATGAALGCLMQDIRAFDLSRSMKARPPIKEIFPWADLAFTASLVGFMGLAMVAHAMKLGEEHAKVQAENSQHTCLVGANPARLTKEIKTMEDQIAAVRKFAESRVQWSSYASDLAARMPRNAELTVFSGRNALEGGGRQKAAPGSFQLQGKAGLAESGALPIEVSDFLHTIPNTKPWKDDFGSIVTTIKLPPAGQKEEPEVNYTITCQKTGQTSGKPSKSGRAK